MDRWTTPKHYASALYCWKWRHKLCDHTAHTSTVQSITRMEVKEGSTPNGWSCT